MFLNVSYIAFYRHGIILDSFSASSSWSILNVPFPISPDTYILFDSSKSRSRLSAGCIISKHYIRDFWEVLSLRTWESQTFHKFLVFYIFKRRGFFLRYVETSSSGMLIQMYPPIFQLMELVHGSGILLQPFPSNMYPIACMVGYIWDRNRPHPQFTVNDFPREYLLDFTFRKKGLS